MERREALQRVVALMGGTVLAPSLLSATNFWSYEQLPPDIGFFSKAEKKLVAELAETIIPKTSTPGAKDAGVAAYIEIMLRDCTSPQNQVAFREGLKNVNDSCSTNYGTGYHKLSTAQKNEVMRSLEKTAKDNELNNKTNNVKGAPRQFFRMLKDLTLSGYFTSEKGATQALSYLQVPGRWEGCLKLEPGQKSWY